MCHGVQHAARRRAHCRLPALQSWLQAGDYDTCVPHSSWPPHRPMYTKASNARIGNVRFCDRSTQSGRRQHFARQTVQSACTTLRIIVVIRTYSCASLEGQEALSTPSVPTLCCSRPHT
eukprot:jgi/Ulvmu1/8905/UM049_0087.1